MSDAAKLDRHWYIMRMSAEDIPGKHLLDNTGRSDVGQGATLSDAVALYLRLKGHNKPPVFEATPTPQNFDKIFTRITLHHLPYHLH